VTKAGGTPDPDDVRTNMRGSRLGVPFPSHEDEDEQGAPPAEQDDAGDEDQGDDAGDENQSTRSRRGFSAPAAVETGAGWVLGLLLWAWVGLPLIQGGPAQVGKVLRAKFTNKGPGGKELP